MIKYLLLLLPILLISCNSTKIKLRKVNFADTNITSPEYNINEFSTAFRMMQPEKAYNLATTESQKIAAKGLEYLMQNKYEDAADTFCKAMLEKDSLEWLWDNFPFFYYSYINYDWQKLENNYKNMHHSFTDDSSLYFYKDKSKFNIDFVEDSVVIPIKLRGGFPVGKIKINGKYYYFVFDTGCTKTLLGKKIVTDNNIIYDDSKEKYTFTITGYFPIYNGFMSEFNLDKIKIYNYPIYVTNNDYAIKNDFLFITLFKCDGIIGWDLLQHFDFTIDYKNKQLILRKPVVKNIERRNLFWYQVPIVKFYHNNYPLFFFFDSGSGLTSFNLKTIPDILRIDTNNLKKNSRKAYGLNDVTEMRYYKYSENFQCYTITDNDISYLSSNKIILRDMWKNISPINLDGLLGSNYFKDKSVRIDILNGIFEIND